MDPDGLAARGSSFLASFVMQFVFAGTGDPVGDTMQNQHDIVFCKQSDGGGPMLLREGHTTPAMDSLGAHLEHCGELLMGGCECELTPKL